MSREEVDDALIDLGVVHDRVAATLYTVDAHPAHSHLRDAPLSGATLDLWRDLGPRIDGLWASFAALRDILDRARGVRAARSRPARPELADLTRLLRDATVGLDTAGLPVQGSPTAELVTATVLSDRLELACRDALAVLTRVADRLAATGDRLAELDEALDKALVRAAALGVADRRAALGPLAGELADIRRAALGDPMGNGPDAQRVRGLADRIRAASDELGDLARLRTSYPDRIDALRRALDSLGATRDAAGRVSALAAAKILDPRLPPAAGDEGDLRRRFDELDRFGRDERWPLLANALPALERAVAAALAAADERHRFAAGLLDRREELRGRLEAYRMKAVRHGRGEDADLSERYGRAHRLLWTAPCDLPAATRAVAAYQRSVSGGADPT